MEKVERMVSMPKEWCEVGEALVAIAMAVKSAKADGWNNAQDLPAVLMASFAPLAKAFDGVASMSGEFKEDPKGCITAMSLAAGDLYSAFK